MHERRDDAGGESRRPSARVAGAPFGVGRHGDWHRRDLGGAVRRSLAEGGGQGEERKERQAGDCNVVGLHEFFSS